MKILLMHNFYRNRGGECHVVDQQQKLLAERGFQVIPFFKRSKDVSSLLGKLRAGLYSSANPESLSELESIVRKHQPDVAHVHNVFPLITPAVFPRLKALGVPVVHTVHNFRMLCPSGFMYRKGMPCSLCPDEGYMNAVKHRCVQNAVVPSYFYARAVRYARSSGWLDTIDQFIVLNRFFGRRLADYGIGADKQVILPNMVTEFRSGPEEKEPYMLFLGRLSPEKGISLLLRAWESVDGIRLRIAGEGEMKGDVIAAVNGPLKGKAEYLGYVDGEQKSRLISQASAMLVPSLWDENCPVSVLEAMALGTFCIVSEVGGLAEMLEDKVSGLVVKPDDEASLIQAVESCSDRSRLSAMSRAALAHARMHYHPDQHVRGLKDIYHGLSGLT